MIDTKQKILDTAERLIGEQGYAGTSLRHIIADAGVNLAAVHYHFGSKEDLLDQVILRKAEAVNAERLARLDRVEATGGETSVEKVLNAFFDPMIETGSRNPQFVRLMGRLYAEGLIPGVVSKHFQPTLERFVQALHRALPELPATELASRLQFMIGAMSHAVCGPRGFPSLSPAEAPDFQTTMRRLVVFLTGGLEAPPAPEVK